MGSKEIDAHSACFDLTDQDIDLSILKFLDDGGPVFFLNRPRQDLHPTIEIPSDALSDSLHFSKVSTEDDDGFSVSPQDRR